MKTSSRRIMVLILLISAFAARPGGAQKSLADGVDELAAKLAKSYGEGKRGKVAIVPLRELGGGENLLGTYIADTLTSRFFDVGYREMVERQMLDRALQELKLSLTGMIDADSAKKIGKFLHADLVVGGTMTDLGGEVSVNCRMFAVETGQVAAVATTKIVKDDTVKSMWAKKAAAGGRGQSEAPVAEPEPAGEDVQEVRGISFHLKSCSHRGTTVDCELSVVALDGNAIIWVSRESRLVDAHGNEIQSSFLSFGSGDSNGEQVPQWGGLTEAGFLDLVRGIARMGHLRFEGVEVTGGQVPLFEVRYTKTRYPIRPSDFEHAQFRNVRVR
jgi:flagellar FlgO protein